MAVYGINFKAILKSRIPPAPWLSWQYHHVYLAYFLLFVYHGHSSPDRAKRMFANCKINQTVAHFVDIASFLF